MAGVKLSDADLRKVLIGHQLTEGATKNSQQTIGGQQFTFSNTPLQSANQGVVARMIGLQSKDQETKLVVILARTNDAVQTTIIPIVHPTETAPLVFTTDDPEHGAFPPPPDAVWSAGVWGWAVSFSEVELQQIVGALNGPGGLAARALIAAFIGHYVWWLGLIVAFVLAIVPPLLGLIDNIGGKKAGLCFCDTWWGFWWVQQNPIPWGF
jgi:hypothetical protein